MSSEERTLSDTVWTPERGLAQPEVRGISWDNFLLSDDKYLGKWRTDSGIRVTPETALQSTVVLASCRILAETIAGLPLHVYHKNEDGSEEIAKGMPLYKILSFSPNEWQTKPEFFEQVMMNLTLWGNSYTRIRSGLYGSVSALDNFHPSRMEVERLENGRLRYSYTDPETGRLEKYTQDQIMHIRWTPEQDGIKGMVPVEIAREAIGLARACEQHAARFWANSARPGVVLTTEGTLTAESAERLRDNWERLHKGSERAYRTAVLTGGMKVTELGFTNESSQFNATRAAQTEEIARIYRLPLHLIQGASGGDLEVQGQEFVTYTLMPWINRIESAISRSLIVDDNAYVARFDVRGLLRANSQQRASYYSTMINLGAMTINEVRKHEGLKSLGPIGDHHFVPMNTQTLEDATKPKPEAPAGGPPLGGGSGGDGGDDGPPPPAPGGPPSMSEVKTGKAPIASPKGETSKPKLEEAVEESSADWEDAIEDRAFCPTGDGNGIDNSCSSSEGVASPASVKVGDRQEEIDSRLGGMKIEMNDALRLAGGARPDTSVFVRNDQEKEGEGGLHIECTRDVAGVKDGLFSVTVVRNAGTEQDPEVVVDHKVIEVTPAIQSDPQKRQAAAREFLRTMTDSVTAATKKGVSKVVLNAAGHSSKGSSQTFRGYTIWPRMGFDAPIPFHLRSQLPPSLSSSRTLLDLHKTPEGTRWWRDNGVSVDVQLDLKQANSPQMQVFNRFVKHFKRDSRDIEMFEGEDWLSPADQKKIDEIWGTIWADGVLDDYEEADQDFSKIEKRAFCATGPGGGIKNDCGSKGEGGPVTSEDAAEKFERYKPFQSVGSSKNSDFIRVPSDEEISSSLKDADVQQSKIGASRELADNTPVALRIDIPAWEKSKGKTYVVTVHEGKNPDNKKAFGPVIGYDSVATLRGPVRFSANDEDRAQKVAEGKSKTPLATVNGNFSKSRDIPADIDSWTPVGYDPQKAVYFYDKRTGQEVIGGTDAVSVGNTVFTRSPQYGSRNAKTHYRSANEMFAVGSWGLESRALSAANQELYKAQEGIVEENGKWPQAEAHYMERNPFASRGMKCSNCLYFEEGQCEIVSGSVSPEGICKLWIIPEEKLSNPEQRAFCPTGDGNGIDNSCGGKSMLSPDVDSGSGSSSLKVADPWYSEPGEREWTRDDLKESSPISGGSDLHAFFINDTESLSSVLGDIRADIDDVVTLGGGTRKGGSISLDADEGGLTVSSELPVSPSGSSRDGVVSIETTILPTDDGPVIAYDNMSLEGVSRTKPGLASRVSSLMLQKMTESMSRAEQLGFIQAETDAVGDAASSLKGYRLWPQFGFDGEVPAPTAMTAAAEESLPADIRTKAANRTLRVQELIATREGERFWDEFGISVGLTFDFRDKGSLGYARFQKMRSMTSRLRDRNANRSFFSDIAHRAFCPTGEGGGVDNSCGGSSGTAAVVREVLSSIAKTGGFTVHPVTGESPTTGFMCATVPGAEKVLGGREDITAASVSGYFSEHADYLSANPKLHLGGWIDSESGKVYLDLSERFETEAEATAAAVKHNQIAIWDLANGREVRIKGGDSERRSEQEEDGAVRLPPGGDSRADRRSLEEGSRRDHGEEESRSEEVGDCGRGPGGIFGPGNKCQQEGDGPSDEFGEPISAKMRGGGASSSSRVDSSWRKVDEAVRIEGKALSSNPPCRSLASAKSVTIINGKALSQSLKETGVTLDQAAKICSPDASNADVSVAHGTLSDVTAYLGDPELTRQPQSSITVTTSEGVAGIDHAVVTSATLTRTDEEELLLAYSMLHVGEEAQKSASVTIARQIYKRVTSSIVEAEKAGVSEVMMLAAGSSKDDVMKGYRIWPRLGFDGEIPRDIVTPRYSAKLGVFEPYGSKIPNDILSPKAKAEKKAGKLTIQSLYETSAGQGWWEENGSSMPMSLVVGDKKSAGWKRFSGIRDRVAGRSLDDILECIDIEWRSVREEAEGRAFCPNGEGNGIDNSCSSAGGVAAGKPASVRVQSDSELQGSISHLGLSGVDDVLALGGGNLRGADVSIKANGSGFIYVSSIAPVDRDNSSAGQFHTSVSISEGEDGKELGLETLGLTGYATELPKAKQQKIMSLVSEKVVESIETAEKNGFAKVTTFAVGDAKSPYKGYRLWPQFGFDGSVPRDIAKRIPPEIVLKAKGIEPPLPGSSSIPHDLVLKSLASRHRSGLKIQELISSHEGDRWWDENGSDIDLTLDLRDKSSPGYKKWSDMKEKLPKLRERNQSRAFFEALAEERAFCATGDGGGIDNSCSSSDDGPSDAFGESVGGFSRTGAQSGGKSAEVDRPPADARVDALTTQSLFSGSEKLDLPKTRGAVSEETISRAMTQRAIEAHGGTPIDVNKAMSQQDIEVTSDALAQDTEGAYQRTGKHAGWYSQDVGDSIEIASKLPGNEKIATDPIDKFVFGFGMGILSAQNTVKDNFRFADGFYRNWKETGSLVVPEEYAHVLGRGIDASHFKTMQDIVDQNGWDDTMAFFSGEDTVRQIKEDGSVILAGSDMTVGKEHMGTVVPRLAVFGPKIGPFTHAIVNGNFHHLVMDRWTMRQAGSLTGTLLEETHPDVVKGNVQRVLEAASGIRGGHDLWQGLSKSDVVSSLKKAARSGYLDRESDGWEFIRRTQSAYARSPSATGGGFGDKTELNKAANAAFKNKVVMNLAPGNGTVANNVRAIFKRAAEKVGASDVLEVQALGWGDTQKLWQHLGYRLRVSPDNNTFSHAASLLRNGGMERITSLRAEAERVAAQQAKKDAEKAAKKSRRSTDIYSGTDQSSPEWPDLNCIGAEPQLVFDESMSNEAVRAKVVAHVTSLIKKSKGDSRSHAAAAVIERRSAGETTVTMPKAGRDGLHVMGFDAEIPSDIAETLPESLSHCKTLLDLHVSDGGSEWWQQNGREIDVSIDLNGVQGRIFDDFAAGKSFVDIIEEGILDDYGDS